MASLPNFGSSGLQEVSCIDKNGRFAPNTKVSLHICLNEEEDPPLDLMGEWISIVYIGALGAPEHRGILDEMYEMDPRRCHVALD